MQLGADKHAHIAGLRRNGFVQEKPADCNKEKRFLVNESKELTNRDQQKWNPVDDTLAEEEEDVGDFREQEDRVQVVQPIRRLPVLPNDHDRQQQEDLVCSLKHSNDQR